MKSIIEGTYVLVKSDNFDEYLKSCGVNFVIRAVAKKVKPVLKIYPDGAYWVWRSDTSFKTIVARFRFGEKFETDFPDGSGRKLIVVAELDGNKVTTTQELEGRLILDVKEFTEDGMVVTITHGDITAVRHYKRIS